MTCVLANRRCPRTNDPLADAYCPMWQEQVWDKPATGESKLRKECGVGMLFESLAYVGSTSKNAMQEASTVRNLIANAVQRMGQRSIPDDPAALPEKVA